MKIPKHPKKSQSKQSKSKPAHLDQQINSDDIPQPQSYHQQQNPYNTANKYIDQNQDYRTAQQIKISIAKKLIQKTKIGMNKKKQQLREIRDNKDYGIKENKNDDFFIIQGDENKKQTGIVGNQQDQLAEQLKNQYLKSKNKLYIDQQSHFRNIKISQPISYKGHTKCITAIQTTQQKIFSASKDRSIIIWDRETGHKDFITMAKQQNKIDHQGPILCMSYHPLHQILATAGQDGKIKLWDIRSKSLIQTMRGHRNTVNGLKFGYNSNNLCSVSSDRTMKQWDCAQRGIMDTYYGHNAQVLDVDCINNNDFVSSGNDHQNIIWRTQKQTQMIFEGHDYAIDRVRNINQQKFISASQDGYINLWSSKKKKPIYKHANAHESWIVSLDCIKQSNIFASGGCQGLIKIWSIGQQLKSFQKIHEIKAKGIVTDIKINNKQIVATSCDQHRLGRWMTTRVRNQIQVFKFINQ